MLHTRRHRITNTETSAELADLLTGESWTLCTGFRTPAGTLWLNDSTSEDGAAEFAVLRETSRGSWRQIESVTVSWIERGKLLELAERIDRGDLDDNSARVARPQLDHSEASCELCA